MPTIYAGTCVQHIQIPTNACMIYIVCAYTLMCTHVHIHRMQSQLWIGLYMYVYSCLHACQKFEMTKHLEAEIR